MKKFRTARRVLAALLTVVSVAALDGCGPIWVDPYITVRESPLNWVHIHYYNMNRTPIRRVSVYINGMGHVELKKGTSDLISDDFAKKYKSENWHNIKTQRLQIDPKHANDIFQNLVNHGVLDREKNGKASKKDRFDRFIAVKVNLSNNTYSANENIFEVDPDLAEQLLDVVREFDNPTL
jgi:hypothetical protein